MYTFDRSKKIWIRLSVTWNTGLDWKWKRLKSTGNCPCHHSGVCVCVIRRSIYGGMSRFLASSNTAGNIVHSPERDRQLIVNLSKCITSSDFCVLCRYFPDFLRGYFCCANDADDFWYLLSVTSLSGGSRRSFLLPSLSAIVQTSTMLRHRIFNQCWRSSTHLKRSAQLRTTFITKVRTFTQDYSLTEHVSTWQSPFDFILKPGFQKHRYCLREFITT